MCHLQELYAKYKDKGLVVLGLDPADDKKIGLDLLRENGVTFPNIIEAFESCQPSRRSGLSAGRMADKLHHRPRRQGRGRLDRI